MFDVSWSELLILGLVTLIFVGPKELPRFLGTLGRYAGAVRRQANEFRSVFEQAMREAEMDQIQKEMRGISDGMKASLDEATRSVESVKAAANLEPEPSKGTKAVAADPAPKAIEADGAAASETDARPASHAVTSPAEAADVKPAETTTTTTTTTGPA